MAALSRARGREIPHTVPHYLKAGWPHCATPQNFASMLKKIGMHALLNNLDSRKQMSVNRPRMLNE